MARRKEPPDRGLVFRVARLFFEGKRIRQIADEVNRDRDLRLEKPLTRESVYPLLAQARQLGLVQLVPPVDEELAKAVAQKYACDPDCVTVVLTRGKADNEQVAARASQVALKLIRKVATASRGPVGLGLGPGRATLDFSRALSELVRSELDVPQMKLFAICAGCPAKYPEYSSISFFNLFPENLVSERVGLFAEAVIRSKEFATIRSRPGVREAFEERDQVSIVVTSMGDARDEHDLLTTFLRWAGTDVKELHQQGWIGNVQYRPYSATGPIEESPDAMRAVTLFELEDFVELARSKNKHVVLIARRCGACGKTRTKALRPLLTVPALRVWSELVMDEGTARDLLRPNHET